MVQYRYSKGKVVLYMMNTNDMQNSIINIYGSEGEVTSMFLDYCKTHTDEEISKFYVMCLAIPVYDDDE